MERPVEIDTVAGLDVDIDNEFIQYLRKCIITGMYAPANYIDASSEVDYARGLTMTNNPFVRAIISDQGDCEDFLSAVIQNLYKNEFIGITKTTKRKRTKKLELSNGSLFDVELITAQFPSPVYLILSNLNEQISNSQTTIDYIFSLYFPEDPTGENNTFDKEKKKTNFKKKLARKRYLQSLDWELFDEIYEECSIESSKNAIEDQIKFDNKTAETEDDVLEDDEEL